MKSHLFLFLFIIGLGPHSLFAQTGSLDPDFGGGDGLVTTVLYDNRPSEGNAIAVQSDGKILVAGYTGTADDKYYGCLLRYNADGSLDNSFNGTGKILIYTGYKNSSTEGVLIQPDKKILTTVLGNDSLRTQLFLYRFNPDGSPDLTFSGDGVTQDSLGARYLSAHAIARQTDGKILVGGYIGFGDDVFDRFWIERFLPNGVLDHSFDGDGLVMTTVGEDYTSLRNLFVRSDGKIVATGYAKFNGNYDYVAVRYNANGSLDNTFSGDGIASATISSGDDRASDAIMQPDGKVLVTGGAFSSATGHNAFGAARFNTDGSPDQTFHVNGTVIVKVSEHSDGGRSIALQPDGKIWLGGYAHSDSTGGFDMALVRLKPDGTTDPDFDGDGVKIYEDNTINGADLSGLALQPDGKLVGTGVVRNGFLNSIRVARFITGLTTATKEELIPLTAVSLYPNPVYEKVVVKYDLDHAETISINLCDVQGRIIQQLMSASERNAGSHTEELVINQGLPAGNYVVNIQSRNGSKALKIVLN